MKTFIKFILQRILGFERYLYIFSRFIIKKLPWDRNEKDFLYFLDLLPEKGIVLDIGANLGVMSYYLAHGFPRRKVYAFEPVPYNFRNLERIKNEFGLDNLYCYQLALGDTNGSLEIVLPVERSVRFHGLAYVKHDAVPQDARGEVFQCKVEKLDNFRALAEDRGPLKGIKIDVENFEYFVLKGAEKLISEHKPIIYSELWDNENRTKTRELLEQCGYRTMVRDRKGLCSYDPQKHDTQNFFFIPGS